MRFILIIPALLLVSACSTSPVTVLEKADGKDCSWCSQTQTQFERDGKTYFVEFLVASADSRITALYNAVDQKVMAAPFRTLSTKYLDSDGYAEGVSDVSAQRVIASMRDFLPRTSFQIVERYFERVQIDDGHDNVKTELRVWSLGMVPTRELRQVRAEVINRLAGKREGGSPSLTDVMEAQRQPSGIAKPE